MNPRLPAEENPDPHAHPLYKALKRLAADLHTLFELASKEDEKSWHNYLALAKKEVEALQSHPDWKKDELLLYKSLIPEVYDHLNLLISAMQSSQERYKRLATSDLLTGVYNRNYFNVTIVRLLRALTICQKVVRCCRLGAASHIVNLVSAITPEQDKEPNTRLDLSLTAGGIFSFFTVSRILPPLVLPSLRILSCHG